jgi:hypothetical protein
MHAVPVLQHLEDWQEDHNFRASLSHTKKPTKKKISFGISSLHPFTSIAVKDFLDYLSELFTYYYYFWRCGPSGRAPVLQAQSLEFKAQSHQKKKSTTNIIIFFSFWFKFSRNSTIIRVTWKWNRVFSKVQVKIK